LHSPSAIERQDRRFARIETWAARHRLLVTLAAAVACGLAAWWISGKHGEPSVGETVLWAAILVPLGTVHTWLALTWIKRRNAGSGTR
jgi:membrane associated rhomboid family serine protease